MAVERPAPASEVELAVLTAALLLVSLGATLALGSDVRQSPVEAAGVAVLEKSGAASTAAQGLCMSGATTAVSFAGAVAGAGYDA